MQSPIDWIDSPHSRAVRCRNFEPSHGLSPVRYDLDPLAHRLSVRFCYCILREAFFLTICRSIITDYLPRKRVPKSRALFMWGLNAGTLLVGIGLYEFETNDVGVTEAIKRIWNA